MHRYLPLPFILLFALLLSYIAHQDFQRLKGAQSSSGNEERTYRVETHRTREPETQSLQRRKSYAGTCLSAIQRTRYQPQYQFQCHNYVSHSTGTCHRHRQAPVQWVPSSKSFGPHSLGSTCKCKTLSYETGRWLPRCPERLQGRRRPLLMARKLLPAVQTTVLDRLSRKLQGNCSQT